MRKIFSFIHLWLSVPAGLIISIICLTGAILVFEKEIQRICQPHLYTVANTDEHFMLRPSELIARIDTVISDSTCVSSLTYAGNENGTCIVGFENSRRQLSVNPYTGEPIGWIEPNAFFQNVRKLHRWLMDVPQQRGTLSAGKLIVGISTILMVIILASGLYIWIPKTRKGLKNRLKVCTTKGWKRFWYDCHVSLGFYTLFLLLLMALTGLTWSFGWYKNAVYGAFGATITSTGHHSSRSHSQQEGKLEKKFNYQVWDSVFAHMSVTCPTYTQIKLEKGKAQAFPLKKIGFRETVTLNFREAEGKKTEYIPVPKATISQKLRIAIYALHTGTWGGWPVKTIYFLTALIGGILPLTGYYLWLKRIIRKRKNTP